MDNENISNILNSLELHISEAKGMTPKLNSRKKFLQDEIKRIDKALSIISYAENAEQTDPLTSEYAL